MAQHAMFDLSGKTAAIIGGGVTINATGNLEVKASSSVDAIARGLSTSTNSDADTGVAAAVALNIALVNNTAHVGDAASLTADNINVEAVMISGNDPATWADTTIALLEDPARRDAMSRAGLAKASRFAWPRVADQILAVYERVAR